MYRSRYASFLPANPMSWAECWIKAPTSEELTQLTHTIARRIARYLERQGLLERDVEGAWLTSCVGGGEDEAPVSKFAQVSC